MNALEKGVPDLQIRLRIFLQCTIQKLLHLLGADIMHHLKDDYFEDGSGWWDWNGPLNKSIDEVIQFFLENLVGQEPHPKYALLISQTSVGMGGLCLLYPSHRAAPDFVINMTTSINMQLTA